uniref:Ovule protein n=2 Tax=Parascaris univalens TaxID=6257 RepID=A0A914ZYC4_PARUN
MDDYSDTVRSRDELIIRDPKKQFVHWSQMFDLRPSTTLRLNQTLCELFVGSKRDLIVPALKWDEGVSFSSAAKYSRTGIGDSEESLSAKGMEHASLSTRKYSERSRREVKISEWQVAVEATAAEGDEAKQVGETEEGSAARFFFRKDTRKSSVSVQERERRSTGFWGVFQENERIDAVMLDKTNPDVMGFEKSFSMLDNLNASVKGASPSRNSSTEGQVLAYGQADESKTIEEVYQKILGIVHRKGGDVVMISELLDKGSGRLVAVRTFCSLLWLVKRKLVTAQQDSLLGDVRITIVRRET